MSFPELFAAADLDEAVQSDPQNAQIWITRGLAYERIGDKTKAAGSYGRAINLRPKDEAARSGFIRVGGKPGRATMRSETFSRESRPRTCPERPAVGVNQGYFGKTEWNTDFAADSMSSATDVRSRGAESTASARKSSGGRGSGISAGGVGRSGSSTRAVGG